MRKLGSSSWGVIFLRKVWSMSQAVRRSKVSRADRNFAVVVQCALLKVPR
jgi:hypothetical protein